MAWVAGLGAAFVVDVVLLAGGWADDHGVVARRHVAGGTVIADARPHSVADPLLDEIRCCLTHFV